MHYLIIPQCENEKEYAVVVPLNRVVKVNSYNEDYAEMYLEDGDVLKYKPSEMKKVSEGDLLSLVPNDPLVPYPIPAPEAEATE